MFCTFIWCKSDIVVRDIKLQNYHYNTFFTWLMLDMQAYRLTFSRQLYDATCNRDTLTNLASGQTTKTPTPLFRFTVNLFTL